MQKRSLLSQISKILNSKKQQGSLMLSLLLFAVIFPGYSQQESIPVGSVMEFYESLRPERSNAKISVTPSKQLKVAADETVNVVINMVRETENGEVFIGNVDASENSYVFFTYKDGSMEGKVIMTEEEEAYVYSTENGTVWVAPEEIDDVICMEYEKEQQSSSSPGTALAPPAGSPVYNLESLAGATAVVMLDFDGHDATGSIWGDIIALPADFTEQEILEIWQYVSEDFSPYELNITTNEAVFLAAPSDMRMRCVFTPTRDAAPQFGGVAIVGSFNSGDLYPCWVFNSGSSKTAGETGSHEIGHTLGLHHDGRELPDGTHEEYFGGHGDWAPVMGSSFGRPVTQWSQGEYQYANNTEDDLAIMGTMNGFGFRLDEAGNTLPAARELVFSSAGEIDTAANIGIIGNRADVDIWRFNSAGGSAVVNIESVAPFANLDIQLTLLDSSGSVITVINPAESTDAAFALVLNAGTYYLSINGAGKGDPLLDGYSDYASIGQYRITGNVQLPNTPPSVSLTSPVSEAYFAAPATFTLQAVATDLEGPIAKVEFYQNGVKIGEDAFYPGFTWQVVDLPAGSYTFTATAFDQGGMSSTSDPVNVTVDGAPPVVSIVSPADGTQFNAPASFTISANASDGQGPIKRVEFYQDGVKIGEDAFYPGFSWFVSGLSEGSYTFTAIAFDQADLSSVSEPVTVNVIESCILHEPVLSASQFVLRNQWYDWQAGSHLATTDSGALKVVHRPYGQPELWVLMTGRTFDVTGGQAYEVSMDFRDFYPIGVTGIDVGFATGIVENGSGPALTAPAVSFPAGFSSSDFTTKSVNITSDYTGQVFLAIKLKWNSQPAMQVTNYIKNLLVCEGAGSTSKTAFAYNPSAAEVKGITVTPNPSVTDFHLRAEKEVDLIQVSDLHGKQLFIRENISGSSQFRFGEDFDMGIYIVRVLYLDGTRESFKVIKSR